MNTTIKKILLTTFCILLLKGHSVAQGEPVYDHTSYVEMGKALTEAGKQTDELLKTVKFLEEQKENIEKVSNVIKQLKAVKELAKNNERLFNVVKDDLKAILDSPYIKPEEIERITESFNAIIDNAIKSVELIEEILSNDNLKMTDGERLEMIKAKEAESNEMVAEINQKTRLYQEIIAFREMQDKINNREAKY
ncbi:conjugal transfer protein [Aureibaculum algae]|uniref:Conjugal transfer protein n=1 Tax=Aureibaculum algae TaxID=2584122 RepID=A0A5B7TQG4_9FLAO|nr:conjugal transfer protein [Aureibaculum algae]QCX37386.1 conjugal transfer protein [Aureibaculum algae]